MGYIDRFVWKWCTPFRSERHDGPAGEALLRRGDLATGPAQALHTHTHIYDMYNIDVYTCIYIYVYVHLNIADDAMVGA